MKGECYAAEEKERLLTEDNFPEHRPGGPGGEGPETGCRHRILGVRAVEEEGEEVTAEDDYLNPPGQMYLYDATKYLQQARAEYERAQKWNWYCTDKIQRAARSVVKFDTLPLTDLERNYVNRRWNIDKAGWFANLLEFGRIISAPDYEELIPRYSRMLHAKQCLYLIVKGEHDELQQLRRDRR